MFKMNNLQEKFKFENVREMLYNSRQLQKRLGRKLGQVMKNKP